MTSVTSTSPPTRLLHILKAEGVSLGALGRALGVNESTVRRWCHGAQPEVYKGQQLDAWLRARGHTLSGALEGDDNATATLSVTSPTPVPPEPDPSMYRDTLAILDDETLEHFNLSRDPFADTDNPENVWLSPALIRIEKMLLSGIERRHIVAVATESGGGKSTLIRRLCARLRVKPHVKVIEPATLDRSRVNAGSLAVAIIRDLTGRDAAQMTPEAQAELLRKTLADMGDHGITPVLVIDEAHKIRPEGLLAIKWIWDSGTQFKDLAVVLVGQAALRDVLRTDVRLQEVTGRTLLLEIPTFNENTARDYLRWRFSEIQREADEVFTPDAYKALAVKGERPLWLNNLAVKALLKACDLGAPQVTGVHVGVV